MDNIAAGKEVLLHDGGDFELKLAQRVKEEGMRKEGGLAPPTQREEEATTAWPVAVSGIEAGGVAVPAPVVQRDDPPR